MHIFNKRENLKRSGNRSVMPVSILKQAGVFDAIYGGGLEDMLQKIK